VRVTPRTDGRFPELLFIQGAGPDAHDAWDQPLVDSLRRALACEVRYPRMPDEGDPSYARWKPALAAALDELADGALLVGHSVGGTVLLHLLAEHRHRVRPGAIAILAAPFVGPGGWPSDGLPARTSFDLDNAPISLFYGTADTTAPPTHAALYAGAIPGASVHLLDGLDHQFGNDLTEVVRLLGVNASTR